MTTESLYRRNIEDPNYEPDPNSMRENRNEIEDSPYEKRVSPEEIKYRINRSLNVQSDPQEIGKEEPPSQERYIANELSGSRPFIKSSYADNKRVVPKAIHEEFSMNNTYSQRLLQNAQEIGARNLATTSIKAESPYKYERIPGKNNPKPSKVSPMYRDREPNIPAGPSCMSKQILSRVLDGDLSIHSPSKKMQETIERKSQSPSKSEYREDQLKNTNTVLEQFADKSTFRDAPSMQITEGSRELEEALESAIESLEQIKRQLSIEDHTIRFAGCLNNVRKDVRLGGLVGLYMLWRMFPNDLNQSILDHILQNLFTQLIHCENQTETFLIASLEFIGFLGPNEISCNSISIIRALLLNSENESQLQTTTINTLVMLGHSGIITLIDIANKDYAQLQHAILSRLCEIPFIQVSVYIEIETCINSRIVKRIGSIYWI